MSPDRTRTSDLEGRAIAGRRLISTRHRILPRQYHAFADELIENADSPATQGYDDPLSLPLCIERMLPCSNQQFAQIDKPFSVQVQNGYGGTSGWRQADQLRIVFAP